MEKCLSDSQLLQYLSQDLESEELQRFSIHLDHCQSCQKRIESYSDDAELKVWHECHQRQLQEDNSTNFPFTREHLDRLFHSTLSSINSSATDSSITQSDSGSGQIIPPKKIAEETPIRVIGNYRLIAQIGQGGMGVVFLATHTHLKKQVVVKLILSNEWNRSKQTQRFYREMEVIGNLNHPNIVKATDGGIVDGTCFLVMEYLDGRDLKSILKTEGRIPFTSVCYIIRQVANGLQHIHNNGLIHRDIKPSNLFLTVKGEVKILDLGLAALLHPGDDDSDLTDTNCIMGSVYYMAPEQSHDIKTIDHRADIYSLGCTFYQLLTGSPPFKKVSQIETILAHRQDPAPSLVTSLPDIPPELEKLYQSMVQKDRDNRIQSMAEIVNVLDTYLEQLSDHASEETSDAHLTESQELKNLCQSPQLSPAIDALHETAGTLYRRPKRSFRRQAFFALISALVMCAVGMGLFLSLNRNAPDTTRSDQTEQLLTTEETKEISPAQAKKERETAEWLLKNEFTLNISNEQNTIASVAALPDQHFYIEKVSANPQTITREILTPLKGLANLENLNLNDCQIEPDALQTLEDLSNLLKLDLHNTDLTDTDLAYVSHLKNLTNLSIQKNSKLTDEGLQVLNQLHELKSVNLAKLKISDKGIKFIENNPRLIWLNLEYTQISDESLPLLKSLQTIQELYLKKTKITEKGFQDLTKSLPGSAIINY